MDIVLKEADVKRLMGEALGVEIPPEEMVVEKEPFTVTISNAEKYLYKKRVANPPPPEEDDEPPEDDDTDDANPSDDDSSLFSMEDLKRQSAGLADMPPQTGGAAKGVMSGKGRALRPNESAQTPPPTERGKEQ
jgi:hypothetical protein